MNTQMFAARNIPSPAARAAAWNYLFNLDTSSRVRRLPGRRFTPAKRVKGADFLPCLTLHLTEVAARLTDDDLGILHLEVGAMALATQDAVARREFSAVYRHFSFIGYLFDDADHELRDALVVSYLEALFMGNAAPAWASARRLLPACLANALEGAEEHFRRIEARLAGY